MGAVLNMAIPSKLRECLLFLHAGKRAAGCRLLGDLVQRAIERFDVFGHHVSFQRCGSGQRNTSDQQPLSMLMPPERLPATLLSQVVDWRRPNRDGRIPCEAARIKG